MRAAGAAAVLAWALAGCSAMGSSQQDALKDLQEAVEAYNDAYRWKNYERAALFLPVDTRGAFLASYEEDDKSLHVEGHQVLQADLLGAEAAKVTVRVTYMELPSVTLENRTLIQHWHKVGGRWLLETEENSIRPLDPAKAPADPSAFGGGPEPAEGMELEVTDPSGQVIKGDGTMETPEGDPTP